MRKAKRTKTKGSVVKKILVNVQIRANACNQQVSEVKKGYFTVAGEAERGFHARR